MTNSKIVIQKSKKVGTLVEKMSKTNSSTYTADELQKMINKFFVHRHICKNKVN